MTASTSGSLRGPAPKRTGVPLAAGTYAVSVGRGGNSNAKDGSDTSFAGLVAYGGGGGGGWCPTAGNPGGCGTDGGGDGSAFNSVLPVIVAYDLPLPATIILVK